MFFFFKVFKDKNELLDYVKKNYDQLVEKNTNLGQTVLEITNAIKNFSTSFNIDSQVSIFSQIIKICNKI